MKSHELPFGKIIIIRDDIAEVIINDGVEMNREMVEDYHNFLLSNLHIPFSLLINKINTYSYDFHAQEKLATLNEINAMAVVAYNQLSKIATESLKLFPRSFDWNLSTFENRDDALTWLFSEQDEANRKFGMTVIE